MEPKIVDSDRMLLLGLDFFGDPFQSSSGWTEENEIGRLWQRFMAFLTRAGQPIRHVKESDLLSRPRLRSLHRLSDPCKTSG